MDPQTRVADPVTPAPLPTPAPADTPRNVDTSEAPATNSFRPGDPTAATDRITPGPTAQLGAVIAGYKLLEFIGRGGMGIVFKAQQPHSGQTVALKMIRGGLFTDRESVARFDREFQALGRMQSVKNIIPIYHVGHHAEETFYVMPYLAGGALSRRLHEYRGDLRRAVVLVEKIARAVHQLHLRNILHRDIKPGNVLLDADGEPYLGDFGLIKFLDDEHTLTRTEQRLGTLAYMAPEQTGLVPTPIGPHTDIWALGIVLFELLVGVRPFTANVEGDSTSVFWKIANQSPPRPCKLQPAFDRRLEAVILKCLEKEPEHRFASAEALADELARWLRDEKLHTSTPSLATPLRRFVTRRPHLSVGLALAVFTLIAFAVVAAVVARRESPAYILETLRDDFRANGTIDLVPDQGRPRWHQSAIGSTTYSTGTRNGAWLVESWDAALVELLRDPPCDAYRLRAEIAHIKSDLQSGPQKGQVGIFIAHQATSTNRQTPHLLCNLVYNDIVSEERPGGPKPGDLPGNIVRLKYRIFADTGVGAPMDDQVGWTKSPRFQRAGAYTPVWRTLELTIDPDNVTARFDGQAIGPLDRTYADAEFRKFLTAAQRDFATRYAPLGDVSNLSLDHHGSLGLVVSRGSLAVKSVTLTRIRN